jgi:alanyl-tRNA synthetase
MNSQDIRKEFLDFFEKKGHVIVPSAPMVIKNDPSLMFTNAGMNQFKEFFLGHHHPQNRRVADTQKCLRVSGKHNDLEEVGHDSYHHTMFEMLGNWSFGDYFKEDALAWAWELLTQTYGIPQKDLYVSVFRGDEVDKIQADAEAGKIWKSIVGPGKVLNESKKNNFWEMGGSGPCGPSSEIHIDLRSEKDKAKTPGKELVNKDHPEVIELWNIVFIQFNRLANGELVPLEERHVDTGLGLERLARVVQGKNSNYDSDIFSPLLEKVQEQCGRAYGKDESDDIAFRVIVDHIRAIAFAISEGQLPGNAKAGYVIRRILRRAIRYGHTFLGFQEPFLYDLAPVLSEQLGPVFPELRSQKDFTSKVIMEEEISFFKTLSKGLNMLEGIFEKQSKSKVVPGLKAFELYDTYGFPLDLTSLIGLENGFEVDLDGFNEEMGKQKARSKEDAKKTLGDWISVNKGSTEFVGYDELSTASRILKYRRMEAGEKSFIQVMLDKTPFYPEGGGQVGDIGYLMDADERKYRVIDTQKESGQILHILEWLPENIQGEFKTQVSREKRYLTMANHSATHLMHAALRRVLGTHVEQRGSYLDDQILRFDFSHFEKLGKDNLSEIEDLVNQQILKDIHLEENREMEIEEAKKMGAMALFGEKYGEKVRVVVFDPEYSVELCAGTHISSTGKIGLFKIIHETSVAAGVRRIEACTGLRAIEYVNKKLEALDEVQALMKNPKDLKKSVVELIAERSALAHKAEKLGREKMGNVSSRLSGKIILAKKGKMLAERIDLPNAQALKDVLFGLKNSHKDLVGLIGSEIEGKPMIGLITGDEIVEKKMIHAGEMIREIAKEIKGGGGGQAYFATAGGKNAKGLDEAIKKGADMIREILNGG